MLGLGLQLTVSRGRAAAAVFTPGDIAGLQFHVDATTLTLADLDPVASWTDLSGNARHATQATLAKQPTFRTNVQNGKPVVRFDGVDDVLLSSVADLAGVPLTLFAVYKAADTDGVVAGLAHPSLSSRNVLLYKDGANSVAVLIQNSGNALYASGAASGSVFVLASMAIRGTDASSTGQVYINGVSVVGPTASSGAANATGYQVTIGGLSVSNGSFCALDLAEALIYTADLSTTDRQKLEAHLKAKWGLA